MLQKFQFLFIYIYVIQTLLATRRPTYRAATTQRSLYIYIYVYIYIYTYCFKKYK
jgi:hypothetical protein